MTSHRKAVFYVYGLLEDRSGELSSRDPITTHVLVNTLQQSRDVETMLF